MFGNISTGDLQVAIAKGWKPNQYLSNMSMAYFADRNDFFARRIFPICPVQLSTSYYYEFSRADLARDNVRRKPSGGKVAPAVIGHTDKTYKCEVEQIILPIDQIGALDYQRSRAPGSIDPRRNKVRVITEQMDIHLDRAFSAAFMQPGVWAHEYAGVASTPSGNQFLKFTDANFDPVHYFDEQKKEMKRMGRREPNKLSLGYDAYLALKSHPDILERVKYSGSTPNPAVVNEKVLAELFGLSEVTYLASTDNAAAEGQEEDMQFIADSTGALLTYTTPAPQIDEPSAGYIFTWDMLGNGQWIAMDQYEGEKGTHTEFVEGLMAFDMKKTSDELGMYFKDCV